MQNSDSEPSRRPCTAARPWPRSGRVEPTTAADHPEIVLTGTSAGLWPGEEFSVYECPHCGASFALTAPEREATNLIGGA